MYKSHFCHRFFFKAKVNYFWAFVKVNTFSLQICKSNIFSICESHTFYLRYIILIAWFYIHAKTYFHIDFVSFYCHIHLLSIVFIKVYIDYTLTIFESKAPNQPKLYCSFRKGNLQFLSIFMYFLFIIFFSFPPNF